MFPNHTDSFHWNGSSLIKFSQKSGRQPILSSIRHESVFGPAQHQFPIWLISYAYLQSTGSWLCCYGVHYRHSSNLIHTFNIRRPLPILVTNKTQTFSYRNINTIDPPIQNTLLDAIYKYYDIIVQHDIIPPSATPLNTKIVTPILILIAFFALLKSQFVLIVLSLNRFLRSSSFSFRRLFDLLATLNVTSNVVISLKLYKLIPSS